MYAGVGYEGAVRATLQRAAQDHAAWPRMFRRLHVRWSGGPDVEPHCGKYSVSMATHLVVFSGATKVTIA